MSGDCRQLPRALKQDSQVPAKPSALGEVGKLEKPSCRDAVFGFRHSNALALWKKVQRRLKLGISGGCTRRSAETAALKEIVPEKAVVSTPELPGTSACFDVGRPNQSLESRRPHVVTKRRPKFFEGCQLGVEATAPPEPRVFGGI